MGLVGKTKKDRVSKALLHTSYCIMPLLHSQTILSLVAEWAVLDAVPGDALGTREI
jgi:hypothetical protein